MHPILNIAISAARKAGNVMLRSIERLDTINPTAKGLNDFVTDVDKKAESEIIAIIKKAHPNHQILAEETGLHPGLSECEWIIDPLDGTYNYMRGFPHFSVSIAFRYRGKLEHGLIFDPIRQELFTASRGEGARLNDRRLRISATSKLANAVLATGFPMRHPEKLPGYLNFFQQLMLEISKIRCAGSAALDLAYVAAGRLDGYFETDLKAWDIAAGALLVKEAGGLVGDWQGGENYLEKGDIIVGTPKVFSALTQFVGKNWKEKS
ncbi:MAG TPA: inositol monophosphatase family protein [Gammaproteobacteria bacterium]|nr:inositol monophosphatase family protein [Gammaproteobacteria bacterium]